ncbi:MAG: hypothetical protein ACPH5P_00215 [Akkermansiaceae bacterium]
MLNKPPFKYDPRTSTIKNAEGKSVLCMTGWNYLTRNMRMAPKQASKATDTFGEVVAHMLNRQDGQRSIFE